jgi:predicted MFS family arabinose efflux permease
VSSGLGKGQRFVLASVCAVAVSTIYAIQPVLEVAAADLGLSRGASGWLVAAGQIGYFVGLIVLVPLGDMLDRRKLIIGHLLMAAVGMGVTVAAPNAIVATAGLALTGLFAVVVQTTVAYVAATSPPGERGRNIGAVTSGVVVGILGARVLAGALSDVLGWRWIYAVLGLLCVALAATVSVTISADVRPAELRYGQTLARTPWLVSTDRLLLSRGLMALFLFASFGTLWSGLALPLSAAPWNFGAAKIGLFGIAGLAGALGASRAGRWADRGRAQKISGSALILLAASWLLIAHTTPTLWLLIAGIIALDFAVQAVHVSSQHLLTTAHPERASGVIGAYMAFYSVGSALGAVTTSWAYARWGWSGSSILGAAYALAGLAVWAAHRHGMSDAKLQPQTRSTGNAGLACDGAPVSDRPRR